MNLDVLKDMDAPALRKYIEFMLWHYRVVDAFWFLYVTERFDQTTAEAINERVWGKAGKMAAKGLVERFDIKEKGLEGFLKAQRLFPWCMILDYQIERKGDEVIITVPACAIQQARLKHGLGEYNCKEMHLLEFTTFAQQVDPRITVECFFAPPDPHPKECSCKWRFRLSQAQTAL